MNKWFWVLLAACSDPAATPPIAPAAVAQTAPKYEFREQHDPNGIGKFYMGREIAHVIAGPEASAWLERPEREVEEDPGKLVELLELKADWVVADVGAGTGYLSFRMAPKVKKVLAEDIQQDMLDVVRKKAGELKIANVEPLLGTVKDPRLPENGVDLVIMVDVYHEFEFPYEMMQGIRRGIKKGGRLVLVEYRGEDLKLAIKPIHKMTEKQVKLEMEAAGFTWLKSHEDLPRQRVLVFTK